MVPTCTSSSKSTEVRQRARQRDAMERASGRWSSTMRDWAAVSAFERLVGVDIVSPPGVAQRRAASSGGERATMVPALDPRESDLHATLALQRATERHGLESRAQSVTRAPRAREVRDLPQRQHA